MQLPLRAVSSLALIAAGVLAYTTAQPAEAADGISSTRRITGVQNFPTNNGCTDIIQSSPVVMMTTAGATLSGPYMTQITIYSDGLVVMSEAIGLSGASAAGQTRVTAETVQTLARDLREMGAFRQCDEEQAVADVPLTTMTVFSQGAAKSAHTYNYWIGDEDQQQIRDRVQDFILQEVLQ